ncbi:MAG: hypothetical protein FWE17_00575 [Alphaproteobacteria bacterium]|nr:hypothetical protein [Alphaproteobacteria bacterium]MCL2758414.1 hypothetical protein [Alphaproteobacteria bacterium]
MNSNTDIISAQERAKTIVCKFMVECMRVERAGSRAELGWQPVNTVLRNFYKRMLKRKRLVKAAIEKFETLSLETVKSLAEIYPIERIVCAADSEDALDRMLYNDYVKKDDTVVVKYLIRHEKLGLTGYVIHNPTNGDVLNYLDGVLDGGPYYFDISFAGCRLFHSYMISNSIGQMKFFDIGVRPVMELVETLYKEKAR